MNMHRYQSHKKAHCKQTITENHAHMVGLSAEFSSQKNSH